MRPIEILILVICCSIVFLCIAVFITIFIVHNEIAKRKRRRVEMLKTFSIKQPTEKTVFLGDSLTEFFPIEEFFQSEDLFNRGVAGDTTLDVINRLEETVYPLKPKIVYLQIGTNDLMYRKSVNYIFENIVKIINLLKSNLKDVKIKVISLYPVNRKARKFSFIFVGFRSNKQIIEINELLKTYCLNNDLTYIDMFKHLANQKNELEKKYTIEGLHISFDGYTKISTILSKYLEEDLIDE